MGTMGMMLHGWQRVGCAVVFGLVGVQSAEAAPNEPTEPATAETSASGESETTAEEQAPTPRPRDPRLVIAGGPIIGPHTLGNEDCRSEEVRCEQVGAFFGAGAQLEVRGRLWWPLYAHARTYVVGNASARERVHAGAWGLGGGFGVYGRYVFARAEYLFIDTFGSDRFDTPFSSEALARDRWGHHAGLVSVGFRLLFKERLGAELWGGPMFGPKSVRTVPGLETEERTLITFLLGLSVSFDVLQ